MKWKTINSKTVYKNPWIRVREDNIKHPSGKKGIYGVVEIPPGIFTIALNKKNEILLIKQMHYPTKITSWELPGGGLKPNNTINAQAKEELSEEANATVKTLTLLGTTQTQPGVTNQIDYFFIGEKTEIQSGKIQEIQAEEGINSVKFFSFSKIVNMIKNNKINHGQTITGLMLYKLKIETKKP